MFRDEPFYLLTNAEVLLSPLALTQFYKQIEEDYEAGKLDDLIEKADEEIDAGRTRPL